MKVYNKLVRDKIPEIIVDSGSVPKFKTLDGEAYEYALKLKLIEEAQELVTAETREQQLEELADLFEVFDTLCDVLEIKFGDVCNKQVEKKLKNGGFHKGIFLQKVFEGGGVE